MFKSKLTAAPLKREYLFKLVLPVTTTALFPRSGTVNFYGGFPGLSRIEDRGSRIEPPSKYVLKSGNIYVKSTISFTECTSDFDSLPSS